MRGFFFELPLWLLTDGDGSVWGHYDLDRTEAYLLLFTDRDAAKTFLERCPDCRPARIRKLSTRRQAITAIRDSDPRIVGVVFDRLPTVPVSLTHSRRLMLKKLRRTVRRK
jgi:hypothetical protein